MWKLVIISRPNKEKLFLCERYRYSVLNDKLSLIFERFRQAEESSTKEYGGTGLGLTISRRLVEIMGGSMWVESVLHEGSTFYFFTALPIHKC
ncbi:MAG: ATP-binding protein [Bacteroidales bacterium]